MTSDTQRTSVPLTRNLQSLLRNLSGWLLSNVSTVKLVEVTPLQRVSRPVQNQSFDPRSGDRVIPSLFIYDDSRQERSQPLVLNPWYMRDSRDVCSVFFSFFPFERRDNGQAYSG